MATVLLMRHAKSSWDDPSLADHDRPLNRRGRRDAPRMGHLLCELNLIPDVIVTSSALRARQTADAIRDECELADPVVEEQLYHASLADWQEIVGNCGTGEIALYIGHNPGLEEVVSALAGEFIRMPTAAIAMFTSQNLEQFAMEDLQFVNVWRPKEL